MDPVFPIIISSIILSVFLLPFGRGFFSRTSKILIGAAFSVSVLFLGVVVPGIERLGQ